MKAKIIFSIVSCIATANLFYDINHTISTKETKKPPTKESHQSIALPQKPHHPKERPNVTEQYNNKSILPQKAQLLVQSLYNIEDDNFYPTLTRIHKLTLSEVQRKSLINELLLVYYDAQENNKPGNMIHIIEALPISSDENVQEFILDRLIYGDEDLVIKSTLYELAKKVLSKVQLKSVSEEFLTLITDNKTELVMNENNKFVYDEVINTVKANLGL